MEFYNRGEIDRKRGDVNVPNLSAQPPCRSWLPRDRCGSKALIRLMVGRREGRQGREDVLLYPRAFGCLGSAKDTFLTPV